MIIIPGPAFLPVVGNYTYYRKRLKALGYHHLVWRELSEVYGHIVGLKLGRNLVVTVFGAEAVREVLSREDFDGRPDGFFFRLRTFGKRLGIVFSDGQFWKKQRKFSLQHLRNFGFGKREMEEKIQEETRSLIAILKNRCSEPIFMHSAFDISVLNGLWAMMAGQRFETDDERLRKLLNIIHDAFRLVDMSGGLINQMPFLRHIAPNACGYNQIMDILNRMWTFLEVENKSLLKYTEAVLMEIQRRTNIAPLGIAHRAIRDTELFGYNVPEGTMILTSLYSVHMDETFWKDPIAFRPERFLNHFGDIYVNEKYFIPFGQGKRRCLGESLGKANIFLFFTTILHIFNLEKADDSYPQLEGFDGVTIAPKPFKAKLIPRTD
ncbi:hypothetical protein NQ314_017178 [Rhamnusium bicolor]|uniref:Cytochrome P450 n=1 Tax=Rhamnusium bicolor TaxID=1586634 RepID=A0AAV8WWP9_9CUCU|nr:hypothetical protein NQ314_017178 [Rhamnusium bicolor]